MKPFCLIFLLASLFGNVSLAHGHIQFIENKGQWNNKVLFQTKISSGELYLEKNYLTFHFWDSKKVSDLFHQDGNAGSPVQLFQCRDETGDCHPE